MSTLTSAPKVGAGRWMAGVAVMVGMVVACMGQGHSQELAERFASLLRVPNVREGDWAIYAKGGAYYKETVLRVEETADDVIVHYRRENTDRSDRVWDGEDLRFSLSEERAIRKRELELVRDGNVDARLTVSQCMPAGIVLQVIVFTHQGHVENWYSDQAGVRGTVAVFPEGEGATTADYTAMVDYGNSAE